MKNMLFVSCICACLFFTTALHSQDLTLPLTNNTSACTNQSYCYQSFQALSDPAQPSPNVYEAAPQNTSKISLRKLMYPNSSTLLLAHFQPWFKQGAQKIATGYNSNDLTTVSAQLDDMVSRGFQGVVIDWYGQHGGEFDGWSDGTTRKIRNNTAGRCSGPQNCPILFAIMEDKGALAYGNLCAPLPHVSTTQDCINAFERDFSYISSSSGGNYFASKAYMKIDPSTQHVSSSGRPAVFIFQPDPTEYSSGIDWTSPNGVWQTVWNWAINNAGNPLFYFENAFAGPFGGNSGFTNGTFAWPNWDGGTSGWIGTEDQDDPQAFGYLTRDFYDPSLNYYSSQAIIGAAWSGFDDYDSFGHTNNWNHPVIYPRCATTFVQSFQQMLSYYSQSRQLPFLGVATWNDYDEGTELETGLDNCVSSFTEALNGHILSWDIQFGSSEGYSGSESSVYNYLIYYSMDGTHLYKVGTIPQGTHQVDLCVIFPGGTNATMYVEAQGMPSVFNHLTNGSVQWNGVQCTYHP